MESSVATRIEELKAGKTTKAQRAMMDFLSRTDGTTVLKMSISEIASAAGLADATVLRFCRSLGFGGFQEFKIRLAQDISGGMTERPCAVGFVSEIATDYHAAVDRSFANLTPELLQKIVEDILSARSVCCFGAGRSYPAALELYNRFTKMGIESRCERDPLALSVLLSSRTEQDVIVLFSVSGETRMTLEAAELARACKMKILVITGSGGSPLTRFADAVIYSDSAERTADTDAVANWLMQFFAVDVICTGLRFRDKARFDEYIAKGNVAIAGK